METTLRRKTPVSLWVFLFILNTVALVVFLTALLKTEQPIGGLVCLTLAAGFSAALLHNDRAFAVTLTAEGVTVRRQRLPFASPEISSFPFADSAFLLGSIPVRCVVMQNSAGREAIVRDDCLEAADYEQLVLATVGDTRSGAPV